jgi:hypothetical protein
VWTPILRVPRPLFGLAGSPIVTVPPVDVESPNTPYSVKTDQFS